MESSEPLKNKKQEVEPGEMFSECSIFYEEDVASAVQYTKDKITKRYLEFFANKELTRATFKKFVKEVHEDINEAFPDVTGEEDG